MEDRELVELAAKAAGFFGYAWLETRDYSGEFVYAKRWIDGVGWDSFRPLEDDGDALRLAATLKLDVLQDECSVSVKRYVGPHADHEYLACENIEGTRLETTRRAIAMAASRIGKAMP